MAARRHIGERRHVLAGKLDELGPHRVALLRDAPDIAGRVLHADDVLQVETRFIVSTDMSTTQRGGML